MRRFSSVAAAAALVLGLLAPGALAGTNHSASTAQHAWSLAKRLALFQQYGRVITPGYLAAKARADAAWARSHPSGGSSSASTPSSHANAPTIHESFDGPNDPTLTPPDSQGAVGPTRFINLINSRFQIFDRTMSPPATLSTGRLADIAQVGTTRLLFDPYIIWDAGTKRFYYSMGNEVSTTPENYQIAWGYSKTASPSAATDWCHYTTDFGVYGLSADFPDYDKLGDTKNFLLIGINNYPHLQTFAGADVAWIAKPPKGTTCLPDNKVKEGVQQNLLEKSGAMAFTPVPANQIDASSTGYVLANTDLGDPGDPGGKPLGPTKGHLIDAYAVTKNTDGTANISTTPTSVTVGTYKIPPSAPQMGSSSLLDTLDGRLSSDQEAIDPTDGKAYLYTQQSVAGGAGSEVHWYKIDTTTLTPGGSASTTTYKVTDPNLFVWNANPSSDRVVKGTTKAFGDSVVIGFTTSSLTSFATDQMVSKIGSGAQSAFVLVHAGGVDACGQVCRWGDYSAATPDPAADPNGSHGVVWLSNMYKRTTDDGTWNWSASP
jgi:hypothetical protein